MNLLRVAVEDSLDVGIRQVAAITFKNATRKDWDPLGDLPDRLLHTFCMPQSRALPCPSPLCCLAQDPHPSTSRLGTVHKATMHLSCLAEGSSPIPDSDKAAVRDNLLEGVMRAPPLVRTQLGESMKAIAGRDYPEHWPGLLPALLQNLSLQVAASYLAACKGLPTSA